MLYSDWALAFRHDSGPHRLYRRRNRRLMYQPIIRLAVRDNMLDTEVESIVENAAAFEVLLTLLAKFKRVKVVCIKSWERDKYSVTCKACANKGRLILSSDDWNRFESHWEGFKEAHAYQYNPTASRAKCEKCESTDIEVDLEAN